MLFREALLKSSIYTSQGQKIPEDFQALVALVAKKLRSQMSCINSVGLFFFFQFISMVFREAIGQWLEHNILLYF